MEAQTKTMYTIMVRNRSTGLSEELLSVVASTPAEAKSIFHINTGQYDNARYSYWVKHPVCK